MPTRAPISYHVDLYRYWLAKRGDRTMPARRDVDPADVLALLPYLRLVDKVDRQFRHRLVGTATVQEAGYDPTGTVVGSQVSNAPGSAAAVRAVYERVFAAAHPVFTTIEYKVKSGSIHNISLLILPLSDDGTTVNMAISTLVARFNFSVTASIDLKGLPLKVCAVIDVVGLEDLEKLCLEWERYCGSGNDAAEGAC